MEQTITPTQTLPKTSLKRITAYIEPELFTKLEKLAKADRRTISQMVGVLVEREVSRAIEEGKID